MITISNLHKSFGALHVLRGLDLEFREGEVTAILGPNASGKTTLLKSILGLVNPDEGAITVKDITLNGNADYRRWIGYMPQTPRYPENLTVRQVLTMIEDLRDDAASRREEFVEPLRLTSELDKPLKTLSGGTRQKVSAVIALMFDPDIIILDEPTAGLDPLSSSVLKDFILEEKRCGKTVLLTSHIMSEIEELADRVVYLLEGKIRFDGSVEELTSNAGEVRLERAIARLMEKEKNGGTEERKSTRVEMVTEEAVTYNGQHVTDH